MKPWESPYVTFGDNPIYFVDPLGLCEECGESCPRDPVKKTSGPSLSNFSGYLPGFSPGTMARIGNDITNRERENQQRIDEINRTYGRIKVLPERNQITDNYITSSILWSIWDLYSTPENYDILGGGGLTDRTFSFGFGHRFRGKVDDQGYLLTGTIEFAGDPDNPDIQYAGPVPWKSIASGFLRDLEGLPFGKLGKVHTLTKHVGKNLQFLLNRLATEKISAAFTFFNEAIADCAAFSTILEKQKDITSWLQVAKDGDRLAVQSSRFPFPVGKVVYKGSKIANDAYMIELIIEKTTAHPNGYIIGTIKGFK